MKFCRNAYVYMDALFSIHALQSDTNVVTPSVGNEWTTFELDRSLISSMSEVKLLNWIFLLFNSGSLCS